MEKLPDKFSVLIKIRNLIFLKIIPIIFEKSLILLGYLPTAEDKFLNFIGVTANIFGIITCIMLACISIFIMGTSLYDYGSKSMWYFTMILTQFGRND